MVARFVHIAKTLVAWAVVYSGALRLWLRWRGSHAVVLAYHRVSTPEAMRTAAFPAMHVQVTTFRKQLEALQSLYAVVGVEALRRALEQRQLPAHRCAVVTFDDGYRDNYRNAFPVLQALEIPATFFVAVGFVGERQPFWFDRVAAVVRAHDESLHRNASHLEEPLATWLRLPEPLDVKIRRITEWMKRLDEDARQSVLQRLEDSLGAPVDWGDVEPMRWEELRQMQAAGMEVGAHSVSHGLLPSMPESRARYEVEASVETVQRQLGRSVRTFAYPNGDTSAAVERVVTDTGVQAAFTMQPQPVRVTADPMALGRYNVCEATSRDAWGRFSRAYFLCEITGVFDGLLRRQARRERAGA